MVTFYDLYHQKPVGRHRIRVCTNLSCQLRGAEEIMEALRQELGVGEDEVTPDGRCSYVHFECLGSCDTAPMMMVDDDYHENLTPRRVRDSRERSRSRWRFEPVLTATSATPTALTLKGYREDRRLRGARQGAQDGARRRSSRRSRSRACAAAAAPASPPA